MKPTLGVDPEFFLKKGGNFVPAYVSGITGGKYNPQPLESGGFVQVDGMALEVNSRPSENPEQLVENINNDLGEIRRIVSMDLEFSYVPVAYFDVGDFENTPPEFKSMGCEPDYESRVLSLLKPRSPENSLQDIPIRSAGGHIHIGFTKVNNPRNKQHLVNCRDIVREIHNYFSQWEDGSERNKIYGSGGAFRPKHYGLEYRSPSNVWLNWSYQDQIYMFSEVQNIVNTLLKGKRWTKRPSKYLKNLIRGAA